MANEESTAKPNGRPTLYTNDLADLICAGIAKGISLVRICEADDMPEVRSIYRWRREHESFSQNYTRAREDQADFHAEEILEISDNGSNDWMAEHDPDNPGYKLNGEHLQRSKLRVDTRKWIASKFKPNTYADKIKQELSNPDGSNISFQFIPVSNKD